MAAMVAAAAVDMVVVHPMVAAMAAVTATQVVVPMDHLLGGRRSRLTLRRPEVLNSMQCGSNSFLSFPKSGRFRFRIGAEKLSWLRRAYEGRMASKFTSPSPALHHT